MSALAAGPSRRPGPNGAGGFTLLEVLVALAILSVAVVACIQAFAGGLRLLKLAADHQRAAEIADRKAREYITLTEGRETGTEGQFAWERTVRTVEVPPELVILSATPYYVYAITVDVRWGESRKVEVATLRTAHPPEPGAPASPLAPKR